VKNVSVIAIDITKEAITRVGHRLCFSISITKYLGTIRTYSEFV